MKKQKLILIAAVAGSLMFSFTAGAAETEFQYGIGYGETESTNMGNDSADFISTVSLPDDGIDLGNELASLITYPEKAIVQSIEGEVRVLCTVDKEGKVTDVKILKDIGGGCALEVAQAVRKMKFQPAIQNGFPRPFTMTIPVQFNLD